MTGIGLFRRYLALALGAAIFSIIIVPDAAAQGFVSPMFGYNFGGDSGCQTATDCEDKNWNFGVSFGALGSFIGFEIEVMWEDEFTGDARAAETSEVLTAMGSLMLAPRITVVQPYGQVGIGLIKSQFDNQATGVSQDENQIGWTVGGGVIVFVQRHIGLRGDFRYYHSFEALELVGIDLARDENKLDFGRASFGVMFKF